MAENFGRDIDMLIKVIGVLRAIDDVMPTQVAQSFLCVALHPGLTMQELSDQTGLSQSACSRNVAALGEWHRFGKPGYGLVEAVPDPKEGRRKIMFLTPRGRTLMRDILRTVRPTEIITSFESPTPKEHASMTFRAHKAAG